MKIVKFPTGLIILALLAGCSTYGKYGEPRGTLDKSIFYVEKDAGNTQHPISSSDITYNRTTSIPTRVPQPAAVDRNSTIQVFINKDTLIAKPSSGLFVKQSEDLLRRKTTVAKALQLLNDVVKARYHAIDTYQNKDFVQFAKAKKIAASIELGFIDKLTAIWPEGSEEYNRMSDVYDPPAFSKFQEFLNQKLTALDAEDRAIEEQLSTRGHTLSLEAFLIGSDKKENVAIHVEDYDLIKVGSVKQLDRLGLDLSKEEHDRLDAQMKATQDISTALERLRNGEATLGEAVQQMQSDLSPRLTDLAGEAERLYQRLEPKKLQERVKETDILYTSYLNSIKTRNSAFYDDKKNMLVTAQVDLQKSLTNDAGNFATAIQEIINDSKALSDGWKKATPASMVKLVEDVTKVKKALTALNKKLATTINNSKDFASKLVDQQVNDLEKIEKDAVLTSDETQALRNNLDGYYRDFLATSDLIEGIINTLSGTDMTSIAEIQHDPSVLRVPIEDLKDTFIDLETTPRLPGDTVTIKATLNDGTKDIDTTSAKFYVDRFGYYAELSPAVVLIKPAQLSGGYNGFRFSPVLSWMQHWVPRAEDTGVTSSIFRALDPSIGIHSAFTTFSSGSSSNATQIGLGLTLSFWKNRLQFGGGYNLMADSNDQGRYYYFIGSDLIGLLQTVGLAKQN